MMNDFDFTEARLLLPRALKAARRLAKLKERLKKRGVPVIYVNDNFGRWRSDWKEVFKHVTEKEMPGREIARVLEPQDDDYFILKPKHSGFYLTALDLLLRDLGAKTLIITGIAGNICVLFTAHDAHMREFKVIVPRDCTASNRKTDNDFALKQLKHVFDIATPRSADI
jgi:nicotinamidase-related amidase